MEITCAQMDVLLSFYVEGDLSKALKLKVEEHLKNCPSCREKYEIIKTMIQDLKTSVEEKEEIYSSKSNSQYRIFQNNLSAYVDNELPADESIKIKKYTINNKQARKELQDTYNIRRLMSESFNKTKLDAKKYVGERENYSVKNRWTFLNGFLGCLTFGLYTPTTTTFYIPLDDVKE